MTAIVNVPYRNDRFLPVRFVDWVKFTTLPDIRAAGLEVQIPKNILEKAGDFGINNLIPLPYNALKAATTFSKNFVTNPHVVTIAITALALVAVSFGFYPAITAATLAKGWALLQAYAVLIPIPPFWAVKFATFLYSVGSVLSFFMRAEGRLLNVDLRGAFENNTTAAQA